jgi:periplasmic protein TonB
MEKRLFEDLIDSGKGDHSTQQSKTLPVSLALHILIAAVIVIVPLLSADQLPDPASAVKAFFVEPMAAPAPPPPPPPPAARPQAPKVVPKPVVENQFVAPVEVPEEIHPEESIDMGVEGGAGGVEGGVPGGVLGGVVGGTGPGAGDEPLRVGGDVKAPVLLQKIEPSYPEAARKARMEGVVILEAIITAEGAVQDVKVLKSVNPLLDASAVRAVTQWKYKPATLNGRSVRVYLTVTVTFNLH